MKTDNNVSQDPRLQWIGKRIKKLRLEKGYSSAEIFAYENGLSRVSYWRMEHGSNITITSLLRILDIHSISMHEFFSNDVDEVTK